MGDIYIYWTNRGYHPLGKILYNSNRYSLTKRTNDHVIHVEQIVQGTEEDNLCTNCILDKSMDLPLLELNGLTILSEHIVGLFLVHSLKCQQTSLA